MYIYLYQSLSVYISTYQYIVYIYTCFSISLKDGLDILLHYPFDMYDHCQMSIIFSRTVRHARPLDLPDGS